MKNPHRKVTPHEEEVLDEALEESFPASDPIAVSTERKKGNTPPRADQPAKQAGTPHAEEVLDEALEETFPASDPIAASSARRERKESPRAGGPERKRH